jgi:hypothetical protein
MSEGVAALAQLKHGRYSQFTAQEIAEIREAHAARRRALARVKYLQSRHGLTTQRFSQVALGKIDGRQPRPHARAEA